MHALVLALLLVPPQAPPTMPPVAPPVNDDFESLPDHTGEPTVVEEPPCDCGDVCRCVDCQCPDCPHKVAPTGPPLTIVVWATQHCPHGERAIREIVPALECDLPGRPAWVAGRDYEIVQSDYGPCPQFYWRGVPFSRDGYPGVVAWMGRLAVAMKHSQGATEYRVQKPVRGDSWQDTDGEGLLVERPASGRHDAAAPGWHTHRCPRCGRSQYVVHEFAR